MNDRKSDRKMTARFADPLCDESSINQLISIVNGIIPSIPLHPALDLIRVACQVPANFLGDQQSLNKNTFENIQYK